MCYYSKYFSSNQGPHTLTMFRCSMLTSIPLLLGFCLRSPYMTNLLWFPLFPFSVSLACLVSPINFQSSFLRFRFSLEESLMSFLSPSLVFLIIYKPMSPLLTFPSQHGFLPHSSPICSIFPLIAPKFIILQLNSFM